MAELIEVTLYETAEDVTESLIVFWFKSEGDQVEQGDVLVEIQTQKATFEIEVPITGKLCNILVNRGEVASVGDVLATIEKAVDCSSIEQQVTAVAIAEQETIVRNKQTSTFLQASPLARRIAKELGVDLTNVIGTGPGGRITEEDVKNAAHQLSTIQFSEQTLEISAVRRTISKRMMQSLEQSAQLTETTWADVTALSSKRKQLAPQLSWNGWILRAVVLTLREHPQLNTSWTENGIKLYKHVHLGVAVDTEDGLLVPSIKNADQMSLAELNETVSQTVQKAHTGKLSSSELSGSTFTVSNLGSYGIQFFTPIINPPEAAILGVGQIEKQIVLADGNIEQRERLPLSLTFDHRIIDGVPAARFLQTLVHLLGNPEKIL